MKVLVIGSGGREHAIIRSLNNSSTISEIHSVSGRAGFEREAVCHPDISEVDSSSLINICKSENIELVVIGPEAPLVGGLADELREKNINVFGPGANAAKLEGSKVFSKEFMKKADVPTSDFFTVKSFDDVMDKFEKFQSPWVLKADGLAAGKGVYICSSKEELIKAAKDLFEKKRFGSAGESAILEKFLPGWELSVLILTNGKDYQYLKFAQDHKRLNDGDQGPNTGGMGAVAPIEIPKELFDEIDTKVVKKVIQGFESQNMSYRGVLYVGIMVTEGGPQVLEFNVRFGDPEAQIILPLLDGDWGDVFYSVSKGQVPHLVWKDLASACVVMAAPGYPDHPEKGIEIIGDLNIESQESYFLHAGTRKDGNNWVTAGGRVLNAIGMGKNLVDAIKNAYSISDKAKWQGIQKRADIGKKILDGQM